MASPELKSAIGPAFEMDEDCKGCAMSAENEIWDEAFRDWELLGHTADKLPIDEQGIDVLARFLSTNVSTKAVFDTISVMFEHANDPDFEYQD